MTNHIEAVRRLARAVAEDSASEVTRAIFRIYLVAAGAEVRGPWCYIPGCSTAIKGWRAAADYVARLSDTAAFLRAMANAHDIAEREITPPTPAPEPAGLAGTRVYAADMTPLTVAEPLPEFYAARFAATLKQLAAANGVPLDLLAPPPAAPEPSPEQVFIGDEAALSTLVTAERDMTTRIIERAQYVAFREVAAQLDGWLEVSRENHEGMHRDRFEDCCGRITPGDVRDMLDGAADALGVRKQPRKAAEQ